MSQKTVISALLIALCLLFATAHGFTEVKYNPNVAARIVRANYASKPSVNNAIRFLSDSDSDSDSQYVLTPAKYTPNVASRIVRASRSSKKRSNKNRIVYALSDSDSEYATVITRPFVNRPRSDASYALPRYRPRPMYDEDVEMIYTTMPIRPKYHLYADSDSEFQVYRPYVNHVRRLSDEEEIEEFADRFPVYNTHLSHQVRHLSDDQFDDEDFEDFEEYDEEDFSVKGSVSKGGNWNAGASYSKGGFTGSANVGKGGNWNAGASYSKGGFTGSANVGKGGQWGASAGYNTKVGGGNLSIGGQVSRGGNYGIGASFSKRF